MARVVDEKRLRAFKEFLGNGGQTCARLRGFRRKGAERWNNPGGT